VKRWASHYRKATKRLRASVLFAVAVEFAFVVFLTVFLSKHADPEGDGMEMVGASAAFVLIFLPFSLPALLLATNGRFLMLAAILAGVAAILYFRLLARNSRRARYSGCALGRIKGAGATHE
jgi:hypothetical protein